ncbi:unnamed protein product [Amoebophrya sp. A120]|nr:unnamed protein product [Amoebophrya sp. A120]|eukprot:GSA120T00016585001.1
MAVDSDGGSSDSGRSPLKAHVPSTGPPSSGKNVDDDAAPRQPLFFANRLKGYTCSSNDYQIRFVDRDCEILERDVNDDNLCLSLEDLVPKRAEGKKLLRVLVTSYEVPDSASLLRRIGVHDGEVMTVPTSLLLMPKENIDAFSELRMVKSDEDPQGLLEIFYPGSESFAAGNHTHEDTAAGAGADTSSLLEQPDLYQRKCRSHRSITGHHTKILAFHYGVVEELPTKSCQYKRTGDFEKEWVRLVITSANFHTEYWDYTNEVVWVRDIPLGQTPSKKIAGAASGNSEPDECENCRNGPRDLFADALKHPFARSCLKMLCHLLPEPVEDQSRMTAAWHGILFRLDWFAAIAPHEQCVVSVAASQPRYNYYAEERDGRRYLERLWACGRWTSSLGKDHGSPKRNLSLSADQGSFEAALEDFYRCQSRVGVDVSDHTGPSLFEDTDGNTLTVVRLGVDDPSEVEKLVRPLGAENIRHQIRHHRPVSVERSFAPAYQPEFVEALVTVTDSQACELDVAARVALCRALWLPNGLESVSIFCAPSPKKPDASPAATRTAFVVTGSPLRNYAEPHGILVSGPSTSAWAGRYYARGWTERERASETRYYHRSGKQIIRTDYAWSRRYSEDWFDFLEPDPNDPFNGDDTARKGGCYIKRRGINREPQEIGGTSGSLAQCFVKEMPQTFLRDWATEAGLWDIHFLITRFLSDKFHSSRYAGQEKVLSMRTYKAQPLLTEREKVRAHQKIILCVDHSCVWHDETQVPRAAGFVYLGSHNFNSHSWGVVRRERVGDLWIRPNTLGRRDAEPDHLELDWVVVDNNEIGVVINFGTHHHTNRVQPSLQRKNFVCSERSARRCPRSPSLFLPPPIAPSYDDVLACLPFDPDGAVELGVVAGNRHTE